MKIKSRLQSGIGNVDIKFKIWIPNCTEVLLQKPYHLQMDGQIEEQTNLLQFWIQYTHFVCESSIPTYIFRWYKAFHCVNMV